MAKQQKSRSHRRSRTNVTRGEYNRVIARLNERERMLGALRDGLKRLEHADEIQFKRTAQIQADLDEIKRAWDRIKAAS